jgi:hypothetical protein
MYGCTPSGVVYAEGPLAVIVDGPSSSRLCEQQELADGVAVLSRQLRGFGVKPGNAVGVGRLDLASDIRFADGRLGASMLLAASLIDIPWTKTGIERKGEVIQTVYFRSARGRAIVGRMYDKGLESRTLEPGEQIRYERQVRFEKKREPTLDEALRLRLRELYGRHIRAARIARELVVVPVVAGVECVWSLVEAGALSWRIAERVSGYLACRAAGRLGLMPLRTRQRRERELRGVGIVVSDHDGLGRRHVPLGAYFDALDHAWDDGETL